MALDVGPPALRELAPPRGPGVVDEQMQPAVLTPDGLEHPSRRVRVGEVERQHRRPPELVGQGPQALFASGDQDQPQSLRALHAARARGDGLAPSGVLVREPAGGRLADAAGCAGYEGDEGTGHDRAP